MFSSIENMFTVVWVILYISVSQLKSIDTGRHLPL